ncbi:OstA-like protein [Arcticibacter tournemirensis]|uniref:Organic solvent tolerance-like N-terminal domain-containing protein n=1 Tax=Arcticibacter tournemirensis TaxID=699437 RepID=A0A5M9HG05_9SPHI|nr:hypothetical protein F1649_02590 [Arcticibacter tournemirensis]TQM46841.1 OstA-like protein [Arcticibacter tournemirensis]
MFASKNFIYFCTVRKIVFLLFLLLTALQVAAQRRSQIQLTSSEKLKGVGTNTARFIRPVFAHEGSTLAADSADYNQAGNAFDAFGHVVITQPDGTVIYSDVLNYDGNSRVAILTNNVRMVDNDAVLTTNHLTYNMGTRIGTYIGGGKIDNGQNVLTSKNGYYFASSRDAYFRYDVVVNTPDALIKTDTLKYNSTSKIAWFFGPTNIQGKGQNKQSKLYTENGSYNTLTDQAWFGKKNLYTEGSKSLKGDSLYYDGKAGFGKAINNITFLDTVQKVTLKGDQGIYRKKDESALVTKNAYVIIETEQDSAKVDSIWMAADTLITKLIPMKEFVPATKEELKSDAEIAVDPVVEGEGIVVPKQSDTPPPAAKVNPPATRDTKPQKRRGLFRKKEKQPSIPESDSTRTDTLTMKAKLPVKPDSLSVHTDSALHAPDTIAKKVNIQQSKADTSKKTSLHKDSVDKKVISPADTAKTRAIYAFHNVKIFKSDLQSRSDSAFYSYADSIIRCYKNPIIWTQGSQLTADTIYMQMKNRKLDNMLLQHNGFVVSAEGDSTKFNQVKGKVITGVFKDNKLESMFVDGNAESVYYSIEDSAYTGMNRSLSSRMRLTFGDNKLKQVMFVRKPEGKFYPIEKMPKDIEILDGFIWKPKDRPKSKEEIIPALRRKKASSKSTGVPKKKVTNVPAKTNNPAGKKGEVKVTKPEVKAPAALPLNKIEGSDSTNRKQDSVVRK